MANGLDNLVHFKPGVSGNPAGKPKGTKNFATLIRDMVEDPKYKIKLDNGKYLRLPGPAIVHAMTIKASKGDVQAATWLAKYGYGEKTDITSDGEALSVNSPVLTLVENFTEYLLNQTVVNGTATEVVDNTTTEVETLPLQEQDISS